MSESLLIWVPGGVFLYFVLQWKINLEVCPMLIMV